MASEFEYLGCFNNKHEFREVSTGTTWRIPFGSDSSDDRIILEDGDLVVVENPRGERVRYSIREQRTVGIEFR